MTLLLVLGACALTFLVLAWVMEGSEAREDARRDERSRGGRPPGGKTW